jgi:hypothetical protein
VTVEGGVPMYGATRTLPDAPVDAGAEFDVMIEVASYGALPTLRWMRALSSM